MKIVFFGEHSRNVDSLGRVGRKTLNLGRNIPTFGREGLNMHRKPRTGLRFAIYDSTEAGRTHVRVWPTIHIVELNSKHKVESIEAQSRSQRRNLKPIKKSNFLVEHEAEP